jgi:hypothetical protein
MSKSTDEIIHEAMEQGKFENLANMGKKLDLNDYFETPEDVRMGYSVLKNGEFVPEEVQVLKEIAVLKDQLRANPEETQRKKLLKEIGQKQLKYDLLMERFKRNRGV